MPLRPPRVALLGILACAAALSGCGASDLAATEEAALPPAEPTPRPEQVEPAPAAVPSPAAVSSASQGEAVLEQPVGWDFFGPPVVSEEDEEAGPVAQHLHLRGFISMDDRHMAVLWAAQEDGSGVVMTLAAGESRGGVTLVELSEEEGTATVEHPGRVVLHLARGTAQRAGGGSSAFVPGRSTTRPAQTTSRPGSRTVGSQSASLRSATSRTAASQSEVAISPERDARRAFTPPPAPPEPVSYRVERPDEDGDDNAPRDDDDED
ncbi:hypothetical protein [Alienimonas chondri]|uniref:Uncharacterized protein n=1 Tax=Alienimonas chondri TaxID=2681879 RepID=A0ABX1VDT7_9PLAN|nr:hypothetical protein [Alienimonas chondri]NNJ26260.1 hypothetical protein [Alienimonas chondri]